MKRYIIRHGSTGIKRQERVTYGVEGPPLDSLGRRQSLELRNELISLGIDLNDEGVAVSELLRTKQTAEQAGLKRLQTYSVLNEINTGMPHVELMTFLADKQLPNAVITRAQDILNNPPKELIWISHGLVIMGLRQAMGLKDEPFDPPNCSITEMEF